MKLLSMTFFTLSACLLVSGCQLNNALWGNSPPLNQPISWENRQAQNSSLQHWSVTAQMGGHAVIHQSTQYLSATIVWEQHFNTYDVHLFGPLGIDTVQIIGGPQNVSLITPSGEQDVDKDPRKLLRDKTGLDFPIADFYYWARGVPTPHQPSVLHFDTYHHLTELQQDGFDVKYLEYTAVSRKYDLPSLLSLSGKNIFVKIAIKEWKVE